jgi:hypothetical protein
VNSTDAMAPRDERAIFHRSPAFGRSIPPVKPEGRTGVEHDAPFDRKRWSLRAPLPYVPLPAWPSDDFEEDSVSSDPRVGLPNLREQPLRRLYHPRLGGVEHQHARRLQRR